MGLVQLIVWASLSSPCFASCSLRVSQAWPDCFISMCVAMSSLGGIVFVTPTDNVGLACSRQDRHFASGMRSPFAA